MKTSDCRVDLLSPEQRMLDIFSRTPLTETFRRVLSGIHAPKCSGEYKFAKLQLLRLLSPLSGVIVPLLVFLLLMLAPFLVSYDVPDSIDVWTQPSTPPPPLDPKPVVPTITPDTPVFEGLSSGPMTETPTPAPSASRIEHHVNAPHIESRSIVELRNLFTGGLSSEQKAGLFDKGGTPETERAVMRALRWLKSVQENDGSWRLESGGGPGSGAPPAMTGLAVLTFLAHGETTSSDEFGITIERAVRWLADNQEDDGRFRGRDKHDYSHPIATYAVCEAFAANKTPRLKEVAQKATDIIVKGQHPDGGWDYNCRQSQRSDTSYMGWCIQALKAAQVAGIGDSSVDMALERSLDGLKKNRHSSGGFGYTGPNPGNLTGVGVLCMQLAGAAGSPEVLSGLSWLERATCNWNQPWGKAPLYYWYYVTQARLHEGGAQWELWNEQMKPELVENQIVVVPEDESDFDIGYWKACSTTEQCKSYVYNTTLCALTLQVYYRHLRTFDRPQPKTHLTLSDPDKDIPIEVNMPPAI